MANIQVPLGQSLTKFPNIKMAKPEFEKGIGEKQAGSDIEFLKTLADRGRLAFGSGSLVNTGTIASITPLNGETFYFLGGSWQFDMGITAGGSIQLRNNGVVREEVSSQSGLEVLMTNGVWVVKFDSLIGNGVKTYDLLFTRDTTVLTVNASMYGYILPSETLSSRGG